MISIKTLFRVTTPFAILLFSLSVVEDAAAQDRSRVVPTKPKTSTSRPVRPEGLTDKIVVRSTPQVQKTSSSKAVGATATTSYMTATTRAMMMESIRSKLGIRYRYGTQGPNSYDCSGFIWSVFGDAGIDITRTSAKEFWRTYDPVYGDDRFQFGTLVFFNRLGHVGIVAGEDGFYHASSSQGVTYSKFKGYWEKRIVGYRQIPIEKPTWSGASNKDQ